MTRQEFLAQFTVRSKVMLEVLAKHPNPRTEILILWYGENAADIALAEWKFFSATAYDTLESYERLIRKMSRGHIRRANMMIRSIFGVTRERLAAMDLAPTDEDVELLLMVCYRLYNIRRISLKASLNVVSKRKPDSYIPEGLTDEAEAAAQPVA